MDECISVDITESYRVCACVCQVPEFIFTFTDLRELSLEDNKLDAVTDDMMSLVNLRVLDLRGNRYV